MHTFWVFHRFILQFIYDVEVKSNKFLVFFFKRNALTFAFSPYFFQRLILWTMFLHFDGGCRQFSDDVRLSNGGNLPRLLRICVRTRTRWVLHPRSPCDEIYPSHYPDSRGCGGCGKHWNSERIPTELIFGKLPPPCGRSADWQGNHYALLRSQLLWRSPRDQCKS